MADALVPYGDNRIVLRHNNSVVLYDRDSRRVVARNANSEVEERSLDFDKCPTCGRSYRYSDPDGDNSNEAVSGDASPDYFRMLAGSLPNAPSSPVRQLAEPARLKSGSVTGTNEESPFEAVQPTPVTQSTAYFPDSNPSAPTGIDPNSFDQGYFSRFFQSPRELGRGGKGVVLLAKHVIDRVDLGWYAIKRIPVGNDHAWLSKILTEVTIMSKLQNENLVQYKHVWLEEVTITNFGPSVPCAFICQAYCNAGDLHHFICGSGRKSNGGSNEALKERHRRKNSKRSDEMDEEDGGGLKRLSLDEIYSFFKQITAGINYLHENDFVHRDLKPSNCLLHDTGKELKVLVSDFGEVQMGDEVREGTGATGTISYCAPEVLRVDPQTGALGAFTPRSDVFSLGMVLHFMCFGQLPYHSADGIDEEDEDLELLKDEISRWSGFEEERSLRSDLPDALYQHLSRLLSTNPGHRPSTSSILAGLEAMGISGRISAGRAGSFSARNSATSVRDRSKDSGGSGSGILHHHRRGSRVAGAPMERNRSAGSTSGMSGSAALSHASASLRRQFSPPQLSHESTADTAVATEPDSDADDDSEGEKNDKFDDAATTTSSSAGFRRDSLILRPTQGSSRATSPLKEGAPVSPIRTHHSQPQQRKLLTAAGEDGETSNGSSSLTSSAITTASSLSSSGWLVRTRRSFGIPSRSIENRSSRSMIYRLTSWQPFVSPNTARAIKMILFFAKLLSLYLPCLPSATSPRLVLPLLALALADFAVLGSAADSLQGSSGGGGPLLSGLLVAVHAALLLNARRLGLHMCLVGGESPVFGGDRWEYEPGYYHEY